ncbi:rCG52108 [Rattus norvegicus]|uniref:RCG52108 n=1 Tax=Rattus norvegicus TaxID=10116 RepID=A6K6M4_RAT|nr:rCG52108 [Rattus norvegicus]
MRAHARIESKQRWGSTLIASFEEPPKSLIAEIPAKRNACLPPF